MKRIYLNIALLLMLALFCIAEAWAQDTTKRKTIEITSAFKPVIREAAKISFNAAPPVSDNSRQVLRYNVPAENLFFTYQSSPLQPVAMQPDSSSGWQNSNYIKLGLGNVTIPYVQTGFSFGDGKNKFYNIFANHFSSKGDLPYQKDSRTDLTAAATIKTPGNLEWNGKIGFKSEDYFLYGYRPESLVFTKDQLRQQFQTFGGKVSLRNLEPTGFGLNYDPSVRISVFNASNDINKATEANTVLNVPVQRAIGESFAVDLGFTADLTNYRPRGKETIQNNLFYVSPALLLTTPNLYVKAGVIPAWDNKEFSLLPNLMADITTNDQRFTLQLGWLGYYDKGSFERFASINPWIAQPIALLNTKVDEKYAGFKGSALNHFTYSAKLGLLRYYNMALFANDLVDGKTFETLYASSMQAVQVHGELGYMQGENFNATAKLTLNQFSKVRDQATAWGLLPLEFDVALRWKIVKNFWLRSDLNIWDGADYRNQANEALKAKGAYDLNAGLEYKITKQFNLWFQMNNIFNNKYERWNQYQVYGFNVLGGLVFSFNQK